MKIEDVEFSVTDWNTLPVVEQPGEAGVARMRLFERGNTRVRRVDYGAGYRADHWCARGHVLLVLDGELTIELRDGRSFTLSEGSSFQVADGEPAHCASSHSGARAFIVD